MRCARGLHKGGCVHSMSRRRGEYVTNLPIYKKTTSKNAPPMIYYFQKKSTAFTTEDKNIANPDSANSLQHKTSLCYYQIK